VAAREARERDLFHRPATQALREAGVVNDRASADVNPVMEEAAAGRDEMRAQRRFFVSAQEPVCFE
jgi:hypothetical protein